MKLKIEKFKETNDIKNVSLALDSSKGPEAWKIAKEANLTALLYVKRKVQANHAFEKFADSDVETVVKDLSKILTPEKK